MRLTPTVRRRIYLVALAVLPLLIAYGILDDTTAPLWAALIGAALVPGMAAANTSPPPSKSTSRKCVS